MPKSLTPSLSKFCEKVRVMNQTQSKNLTLTATEARNIESDLMDLLLYVNDVQARLLERADTVQIEIASPGFK